MKRASLLLVVLLAGAPESVRADTALDAAVALYQGKHFHEALAALQKIAAAEPASAAFCYYFGMAISHRGDDRALDDAVPWLEKAVALAPGNSDYLGDYGGTCLELADKRRSLILATRGRDALEKTLTLNAGDLDARDGLMQFYAEAPWPLGSNARARAQAEEISRRDPPRGCGAFVKLGGYLAKKGDVAAARAAYQEALKLDPHDQGAAKALAGLK